VRTTWDSGSDFDGAKHALRHGRRNETPAITEALLQKGYSEGDVKKILGEILYAVMTEVERVSQELNSAPMK